MDQSKDFVQQVGNKNVCVSYFCKVKDWVLQSILSQFSSQKGFQLQVLKYVTSTLVMQ